MDKVIGANHRNSKTVVVLLNDILTDIIASTLDGGYARTNDENMINVIEAIFILIEDMAPDESGPSTDVQVNESAAIGDDVGDGEGGREEGKHEYSAVGESEPPPTDPPLNVDTAAATDAEDSTLGDVVSAMHQEDILLDENQDGPAEGAQLVIVSGVGGCESDGRLDTAAVPGHRAPAPRRRGRLTSVWRRVRRAVQVAFCCRRD